MRNPTELVLKAFLSRHPPEKREALTRFLPNAEKERLGKMPSFPGEPPKEGHARVVDLVHWSWFLPTLKTYPEREQRLFLSVVSPKASRNLAHVLKNEPNAEISEVGKKYLRELLLSSLVGPEGKLLPIDSLPPSPLSALLQLSKKQLTALIDRLSLHDLKMELRHTVETKMMKKLYSFLTADEKKWLQHIADKTEPPFSRMTLERWDGSEEAFRLILHRKGIARLAAGLHGQDPDFIWYICHQLDIGRGNLLFKLGTKEPHTLTTETIVKQIEEILHETI